MHRILVARGATTKSVCHILSWRNVLPYGLIISACLDSPSTQNAHDNSDSVQALTALRKDVEFIKGTQKKMDDKMTKIDDGLVGARINIKEIQTTLNESMKKDMQGMQRSMTALTEGITDLKIEIKTKSQWQSLWQSVIAVILGMGGIGLYRRYT